MSDQNKRRLLLGGTLLTLFIILLTGWLLREPIQERVIEPIAERVWWWWRFAQAFLPQAVMWTLLIMIGAVRLAWFVAGRTKLLNEPNDLMPGKPGQVGNWLRLLHLSHRAQRLFVKPLRFLTVDVLAEAEQEQRDVVFSQLHRQTLPLPKHLQAYLNKGIDNTPTRLKAVSEVENLIKPKTVDPEVEELITELEHFMDTT